MPARAVVSRGEKPDTDSLVAQAEALKMLISEDGLMGRILEIVDEKKQGEAYIGRDSEREATEWIGLITGRLGMAAVAYQKRGHEGHSYRDRILETGALIVACLEQIDKGNCT